MEAEETTNRCCKNCMYWGTSSKINKEVADCDFVNTLVSRKVEQTNKAFHIEVDAADDYNLSVTLYTGAEFYCPHFQNK